MERIGNSAQYGSKNATPVTGSTAPITMPGGASVMG